MALEESREALLAEPYRTVGGGVGVEEREGDRGVDVGKQRRGAGPEALQQAAELVFQLLVGGDIHEDAMIESFAALRVFTGVSSIEHRASVAVGALDLQLEFADVAVTLEDPLLPGADLSVGKVGDQVTAQFLDRWNAKNVEQCLVAIHKSALLVGDVDSLFEVLH